MLKDQVPVAGNSADKRRPLIMVSPRERQKKLKETKLTSKVIDALNGKIETLQLELEAAYKVPKEITYTEQEVIDKVREATSKLEEEYKKEISKLVKEVEKKNKKNVTEKQSNSDIE